MKTVTAIFLLLAFAVVYAGCVHRIPEDGPDTTQKRDANGHPNFGK